MAERASLRRCLLTVVGAASLALCAAGVADDFASDREQIVEGLLGGTVKGGLMLGADGSLPAPRLVEVIREGQNKGSRVIGVTERVPDPASVNLRVEFAHDSAELDPGSRALLAELGAALKDSRLDDVQVAINGHTDSSGPYAYNLELSFRRAESVRTYLRDTLGIDTRKMAVIGFGESVPLNRNATQVERSVNRRVEVERLQ